MDKKRVAAMLALCMTFGTTAPIVTRAQDMPATQNRDETKVTGAAEDLKEEQNFGESGSGAEKDKSENESETVSQYREEAGKDRNDADHSGSNEAGRRDNGGSDTGSAGSENGSSDGGSSTGSGTGSSDGGSSTDSGTGSSDGGSSTDSGSGNGSSDGGSSTGSSDGGSSTDGGSGTTDGSSSSTDGGSGTGSGGSGTNNGDSSSTDGGSMKPGVDAGTQGKDPGKDTAETPGNETETAGKEDDELPEVEDNQEELELGVDLSKFAIVSDYWLPSLRKQFRLTWVEDAPRRILFPGTLIYESQSKDSRPVGWSVTGSVVYILADEQEDWIFVESGKVRGFISREDLLSRKLTKFILKKGDVSVFEDARPLVSPMDNEALLYTMTTGIDPVVEGEPAVAAEKLSVYDSVSLDPDKNQVVGVLPKNGSATILEKVNDEIYFVESGDVRGFAAADLMLLGEEAELVLEAKGETLAREMMAPEENPALYFTITSTEAVDEEKALRADIIEFARQFLGCAYVWGGNELGVGVDCSGFMQQIFRRYGVELPRTSRRQAVVGKKIPVNDAKPGDLIFYQTGGEIHHVAMYVGEGKVIHARGRKSGIVISGIARNAAWAVDVLDALG